MIAMEIRCDCLDPKVKNQSRHFLVFQTTFDPFIDVNYSF